LGRALSEKLPNLLGRVVTVSSLTGGCEKDKTPREVALMELKEEAGYSIRDVGLISLGTIRGTKSSDTVYHLFSCDLTKETKGIATGDGSELEAKAHCFWTHDILSAQDPLVYTIYVKLLTSLIQKGVFE
jgi:8-oxo-dGTP pyrophosphatase MutT (NUDIX family)